MANAVVLTLLKGLPVVFLLTVLGYGGLCVFLFTQQRRMIFVPSPAIASTPADYGVSYEDVWIPVSADRPTPKIHGWWMPAAQSPIGTVLYLHGNGENVGANVAHAHRFHQMGFSVLLIDYRGYGLSDGHFPSEAQAYEDAQAAWTYLVRDRGLAPDHILLYGHSLGGAIAIDLAIRQPEAAGLIVEGSFTSIRAMVDRTRNLGLFPIDLILTQKFDSLSKVRSLQMPVLFIHGLQDDVVPSDMSEALYEAAPEPKQLYFVPEADHTNVAELAGMDYIETVKTFMQLTPLNQP